MPVTFKAIVPKGFDIKKYKARMRRGMDECAKDVQKLEAEVVENWEERPTDFPIEAREDNAGIYRRIFPQGGEGTIRWLWVSFGTRRHPIAAVNASSLLFQQSYSPKTSGGGVWGQPASSSGSWIKKRLTIPVSPRATLRLKTSPTIHQPSSPRWQGPTLRAWQPLHRAANLLDIMTLVMV